MARQLSVVPPDTKAPRAPRKPMTIKTAVTRDERALLVALRAKAAAEIDAGVPAHALSPLIRQLRDIDKEIRALDARRDEDAEAASVPDTGFDSSAV